MTDNPVEIVKKKTFREKLSEKKEKMHEKVSEFFIDHEWLSVGIVSVIVYTVEVTIAAVILKIFGLDKK